MTGSANARGVAAGPPAECILRERTRQAVITFQLALWVTVSIAGLIFMVWLIEYLINDINFVDWLIKRWYVPFGILSITMYSCMAAVIDRNATWQQLRALSSPLNDAEFDSRPPFATSGVKFGDKVVGQRTVTSGRKGMIIWKRGTPQVYLPWQRFEKITVRASSSKPSFAEIQLKWKMHGEPPTLSVPWSVEMGPTVPHGLMSDPGHSGDSFV